MNISRTRIYFYDLDKIHKELEYHRINKNSSGSIQVIFKLHPVEYVARCMQIYNVSRKYSLAERTISKRTNMLYISSKIRRWFTPVRKGNSATMVSQLMI